MYKMDLHRLRFVHCQPQSVHCLAFSTDTPHPKLAVSRGDSSIEIWNSTNGEAYYKDWSVPGRADTSVEALLWCGKKLYSAGLTGHVHRWDLLALRPDVSLDCSGGAVWALQASPSGSRLAAGCEDGQVRLFDISDSGFSFQRGLDKLSGRILSLAWYWDEKFIAVGGADSTIRILSVHNGRCVQRITLDNYSQRSTLIWDLKVLNDSSSTIVSANSLGKVQFWNGKHGTLVQSFQEHQADVLVLVVSDNGKEVYSAGIDQKVVCIRNVESKDSRWVVSGKIRPHAHDIRALAVSRDGRLASGGVDTHVVMCPTDLFDVDSCIKYQPLSDSSRNFSLAADAGVLMYQGTESLQFWSLGPVCQSAPPEVNGLSVHAADDRASLSSLSDSKVKIAIPDSTVQSPDSKKLCLDDKSCSNATSKSQAPDSPLVTESVPFLHFLEIKNKGPLHILSSALSHDGTLVAVSNIERLWLYRISKDSRKVQCLKCVNSPSYRMAFSPCGSRLYLATLNEGMMVVDLSISSKSKSKDQFEDIRSFLPKKEKSRHSHCAVDFQISPDGVYLLTADFKRRLTLYLIEDPEHSIKLPHLNAQPVVYAFSSFAPEIVLFSGLDKEVFTFNINEESLKLAGLVECDDKKLCGRTRLANPNGIAALPGEKNLFTVYDNDCIMLVRYASSVKKSRAKAGSKRTRLSSSSPLKCQPIKTWDVVLFVSALTGRRLVAAEQKWTEVLRQLPPAFSRDRYGT